MIPGIRTVHWYGGSNAGRVGPWGTTLTSAGAADIFVVKYDSDGNLIWAQSAGGVGDDGGSGIATDAMGQVVMTGSFAENATFAGTTLTGEGGLDVFTAKYDAGGDLLWARSAGGRDYDYGVDIAIDPSGNVFVAGDYWITAIFGTVTLTSRGLDDIFVAKYDAAGNFLWARSAGGVLADDGSSGLATDPAGNVLMTGLFQGTIWFGETALASLGSFDIIVAKYGSAGDLLWARSAGGPDGDFGGSIATDPSGSLVVSGGFAATASFGDVTLASAGWVDIFVLKTGPNGLN